MSLIPMLFSKWWEDLDRPHHVFDQHFGHGIHPEDLELPIPSYHDMLLARPHHYNRRRLAHHRHPYDRSLATTRSGGVSTVHTEKDKFQVTLDVQQFHPEEISVKVIGKHVLVEGKHEEKEDDHGWISRQFTRKYLVPEQCDIDQLKTSLSSDGVLIITAPRKDIPVEDKKERVIQIQHTGVPAIKEAASKTSVESQQPASDETVKAA